MDTTVSFSLTHFLSLSLSLCKDSSFVLFRLTETDVSIYAKCQQSGRTVETTGISIDKHSYSLQGTQTGGKSKPTY